MQFTNDRMDINDYIRITKIEYSDSSLCSYLNGVVFANKESNHIEYSIESPTILLLDGKAGVYIGDNKMTPLDDLDDTQIEFAKIFIGEISSLGVSVIISEKRMPKYITDELHKIGIVTLSHTKSKIMREISRTTQGRIVKSIYHKNSRKTNFLGICNSYECVRYGNTDYAIITSHSDGLLGNIVISAPNQTELKKVAMSIRRLLTDYHNAILERKI